MTASCWLSHRFEYTRESEGEERKGPLPNKVCESAFHAQIGQFLVRPISALSCHFSLNGNESCCIGSILSGCIGNRRNYKK